MGKISANAAVIIWNYVDRFGADKFKNSSFQFANGKEQTVDQIIISTHSLRSISTRKQKGQAGGSFTLMLAPTKNWVGAITVGSWCAILMTRSGLTRNNLDGNKFGGVDARSLKFLGRIESVNMSATVNANGARTTGYTVTGVDWSDVFNNTMYVDPNLLTTNTQGGGLGLSLPILGEAFSRQYQQGKKALKGEAASFSSGLTVQFAVNTLLNIWTQGLTQLDDIDAQIQQSGGKLRSNALMAPTIPIELLRYLGLSNNGTIVGDVDLINNIKKIPGKLKRSGSNVSGTFTGDSYEPANTGGGFVQFEELQGSHSVWDLLHRHANSMLNELIADLRSDPKSPHKMQPCFYYRVRPFMITDARTLRDTVEVGDGGGAGGANSSADAKKGNGPLEDVASHFQDVRRFLIPSDEVLTCNLGTAWKNSCNFIEIVPAWGGNNATIASSIKSAGQFYNTPAIKRDGFRPRWEHAYQWPIDPTSGALTPNTLVLWKYLLKEWYFDLHRMLNGSITIIGQDNYIQVGDNIMVDRDVIGYAPNYSNSQLTSKPRSYMLAHVENISHSFTVNENGTKSFRTTIDFVRGIITDQNGTPLRPAQSTAYYDSGTIDQDASLLDSIDENNPNVRIKGEG